MAKKESRGDFKKRSLPEKTQSQRVLMWRKRIEQARHDLMIERRVSIAREADRFLGGGKSVPKKGKGANSHVYLNYALPLLEELHRGSIPVIPTPVIEARTEAAAGPNNEREQATQRFTSFLFDKHSEEISEALRSIQWDDDKMGAAIVRVDWKQKTVDANPIDDISRENIDVQVKRAQAENLNPLDQVIVTSDHDITHLRIHEEFLVSLDPAADAHASLSRHILEHNSRLAVVTQEGIRVERVRNDRYFYDQYSTWRDRGWEVELKFVRVKNLIDNGYKNINPINVPPRQPTELRDSRGRTHNTHHDSGRHISDGEIAYEDRTVAIYEIHDRLNQTELVISVDGPDNGLPLMERPWRYGNLDIYKLRSFHPFEPTQSWGEPLMHVLIPILTELAIIDYNIQRHVQNHAASKVFVTGKAGANKIKKGLKDPNQFAIEIPIDSAKPTTYDPPPIPKPLLEHRAAMLNELRRAVGLDAQDIGASNPAAITATESFARSQAGAGRIEDRQRVISEFLSWIGEMSLKLYKKFAMMAVEVSVNTEVGQEWTTIEPRDLPIDINISFDIESVTDRGRAENIARVDRVIALLAQSPIPVNWDRAVVWAIGELGVGRPEQFRAKGPVGPENILDVQGQAGTEGGSTAPVGTSLNTRANTEFAPGPSDAAAAAEASGATIV